MAKRYDCFAYSDVKCKATTNEDCTDCKFYKTKNQIEHERVKTEIRIKDIFGLKYNDFLENRKVK